MAQDNTQETEIEDLTERSGKLDLKSSGSTIGEPGSESGLGKIETLPDELLLKTFEDLDIQDFQNLKLSSRHLLPAAHTFMCKRTLEKCNRAAPEIYNYLIPEGKSLREYSDRNRPPYQPPKTALSIQIAASLMDVIPEKQEHLVNTVLSIGNELIRTECMAVVAEHRSRFEKANLLPIGTEALRMSAIQHEDDIMKNPAIDATYTLKLLADCMTADQQRTIEERKRSDLDFKKSMSPSVLDTMLLSSKSRSRPPALKMSQLDWHSINQLGDRYVDSTRHRIEDLQIIAEHISKTADTLMMTLRTVQHEPVQQQVDQPSSARDFSARAARGAGGRAD